jgi:lipopolysaccharide export system protein LptC
MIAEQDKLPSGIEHLVIGPAHRVPNFNPFYSRLIRWMRLALPLAALAIAAIVFTWSGPHQTLLTSNLQPELKKTIGKNELVNPRFENTDAENRPYTLTAKRAVQDEQDGNIVILENPVGDMMLDNGHWVAIESSEGIFQQTERKLLLRGNVRLFHDGGYQLDTPELHIDVQNSTAMSDKDVYGQGPEGTLEARGLEGNNATGNLIFKGPAKLVLDTEAMGSKNKGLMQ